MIFIYLHIIMMFAAVAVSIGSGLLLHRVAQSGDVRTIRTTFGLAKPFGQSTPILFIIGLIFGLLAAAAGSFNFLAPWLILSYGLFAAAMVVGTVVTKPWQQRVGKAAVLNQGDAPSADLQAAIGDQRGQLGLWINTALIVAIVFVMVAKPLG